MAKFDVYVNPDGAGYLLDVQADLLSSFNTRVVVPMPLSNEGPTTAKILNLVFDIETAFLILAGAMLKIRL